MPSTPSSRRREGDAIAIPGDYQARAFRSSRRAQRFWHEAKVRLIERMACPGATDHVLDAGCGSGVISHFLAGQCASVVANDSNPAAIQFARETFRDPNLHFFLGQLQTVDGYGPFDWIYVLEVIEHLYQEQVEELLCIFKGMIKPGGHLFLTTPNYKSTWPLMERVLDQLKLVPQLAQAQHVSRFTNASLQSACKEAGWTIVRSGAFNAFAPLVAGLNYGAALYLENLEFNWSRRLPGNLLFCLCRADA
ncbi:MAG: class I SAM-dependent methyltransferase [Chthoniobacterales bacterium]